LWFKELNSSLGKEGRKEKQREREREREREITSQETQIFDATIKKIFII